MRYGDTNIFKRFGARLALSVAVMVALALPVGAGAGVKLDGDDAAVRIPTAIFGVAKAKPASARSQADFNEEHCEKDKGKDKKCDELSEPDPPADDKPPADDPPDASWAG